MTPKEIAAARQKELRRKRKEAGLVEVRAHVLPENKERCIAYLKRHGVKK